VVVACGADDDFHILAESVVDAFEPEDVVVVGRRDAASSFTRLDSQELQDWLEEYTLGELWAKNVFGGGPFG
jgi:hypothetical protein